MHADVQQRLWPWCSSSIASNSTRGTIHIAVGSGARDETGKVQPLDVKEGDAVLFGKWSGTEVKIDGEDYLIMKESDIMGIIS